MNEAAAETLKSADEIWAMLMLECNKSENRKSPGVAHPAEVVRQGLALQEITGMTREEVAISMLFVMTVAWNTVLNES